MRTDDIVHLEELAERLRTTMEAERQEFLDKQAAYMYDEEHKNKKHVITDEERKRMEESRKRALELKEEKRAKKQKLAADSTPATPSPYAKFGPSKSPPVNPYAAANKQKATNSSTAEAASPSGTTSTSKKKRASRIVHITPPSTAKPSTPLASPISQSHAAATAPAKPCVRCGLDYDDTSLCIVWTHKGEIHRQRAYNGWDQFRYDCCNRLDPSPCYVGRNVRSSGGRSGHHINMAVTCNCGSRATIRRTKKENNNKHRLFFTCPDQSCNFFSWCDEAFNLPPRRYVKASDGVDEHQYLHANPFGENESCWPGLIPGASHHVSVLTKARGGRSGKLDTAAG